MKKDNNKSHWSKYVGKEIKVILSFVVASVAICAVLILLAIFSAPSGTSTIYRPCGKIVITSDSKNAKGFVSSTFERCRYFLIYDLATKRFKSVANPYFNEVSPGAKASRFIANRAEEAVITGNVGPVAYQTLENFNIHVYLVHKTSVRDAIRLFLEGKLVLVEPARKLGFMNAPPQRTQEAPEMQRAAWNPARTAYCPIDGFTLSLGAHIQTNRVMCPYHPGQIMQIIIPAVQPQPVMFGPGNNFKDSTINRGVVIMR